MVAICHSVVRAPSARVTRLDCGVPTNSGCDYATTNSFVDITLTKVLQERQDALQLNANGDICVDKPKAPILRWYEVVITFCNVDPELFNIVSDEPLILNDAVSPEAIGWCTLPESPQTSEFALEFWTGTEEEDCDESTDFGYGILPRIIQGMIGDVTINNGNINFTVSGITKTPNAWGMGPYNVRIVQSGVDVGQPRPLLTAVNTGSHKCFMWTELAPPLGDCGCQDLTPVVAASPLAGASPLLVTLTPPVDANGDDLLPAYIDWDDGGAEELFTTTPVTHTYAAPGTYNAVWMPSAVSSPNYVSADIVVS